MRSEMLTVMAKWASLKSTTTKWLLPSTSSVHESSTPDPMADKTQIYKYGVHQVAHAYGKTATFMPKPVFGDNGSGMHVHQSIWNGGKPLFRRRQVCRPVRNLPVLHWRHHQARQGPERLHQPVDQLLQASGAGLRSTGSAGLLGAQPFGLLPYSVRLLAEGQARRSPLPGSDRQPVPGFAAMLMAGIDGIKNKIHPGEAMDKDLYDLPPEELKKIPTVCGSLREALEALDGPRVPETAGGVFDDDQIDAFIELKMEEVMRFEMTPHPVEFDMYYWLFFAWT
jgi:glutamine synthetase